jgi:hypothetical protein
LRKQKRPRPNLRDLPTKVVGLDDVIASEKQFLLNAVLHKHDGSIKMNSTDGP